MKASKLPRYRKLLKGKCLFLIGNGESVLNTDLSQIPYESCMTMNRSWSLKKARYHCTVSDTRYLRAAIKHQPEVLFVAGKAYEIPGNIQKELKSEVICVPRVKGAESLNHGWNPTHTGLFALEIAMYLRVEYTFLIGYDGYGAHFERDEIRPQKHDHKRHKEELKVFARKVGEKSQFKVFNTNKHNAYEIFPWCSLEAALTFVDWIRMKEKREAQLAEERAG